MYEQDELLRTARNAVEKDCDEMKKKLARRKSRCCSSQRMPFCSAHFGGAGSRPVFWSLMGSLVPILVWG